MSSAASRPQKSANQSDDAALNSTQAESTAESTTNSKTNLHQPPSRSLLRPPARPKPPARPEVMASSTPPKQTDLEAAPAVSQRPGPISLPSDPRQYRAIGLIKGKYIASEEQLNRGNIQTRDGRLIDAVLLGRVTSLLKKHIDLDKDHLWVVYPRTLLKEEGKGETPSRAEQRSSDEEVSDQSNSNQTSTEQTSTEQFEAEKSDTATARKEANEGLEKIPALHVQIVGVWEPETLNAEAMEQPEESRPLSSKEAEALCDQFSIRGEVAKYSEESGEITINIVQQSKSANTKPKRPFKLLINGQLEGRTTGYFWDLTVERQEGKLVLKEGKSIGVVPPKKKPKGQKNAKRRPPSNKTKGASGPPKPKPKPKTASTIAQNTQKQSKEQG
ncbi:hypothetical protein S7335_1919 [Synechococcus sp. PCC 7335]|uniref:hypothetical protein n=1 Tax=Synechococcus sp. (strain ATCC 29403 / PCC 7335) TaxID=91464 RepID=UPI00017ECB2C|nr:hypothetical protein [Synechococcus sp. PCC 7335]EDX84222.1 hypothetical protein S7335_1919 [Synechococcus sp. PCC 7335]